MSNSILRLVLLVWLFAIPALAQPAAPADERALREAVATNETQFGSDDRRVGTSLRQLAFWLEQRGRHADAEAPRRRALANAEKSWGPTSRQTADDLLSLANVLGRLGRNAEAEPLARRSLGLYEAAVGPDHPAVGGAVNSLGGIMFQLGRFAEAEPLFLRAIALDERASPPDPDKIATSLQNLGVMRARIGRHEDAVTAYRRALEQLDRAPNRNNALTIDTSTNLATSLVGLRRYAEADEVLGRVRALAERTLGPEHPVLANINASMSSSLYFQRRLPEAIAASRRAIEIRERLLPPDHPQIAESFSGLASNHFAANQHAEALAAIRRSTEITRARLARSGADLAERQQHRLAFGFHVMAAQTAAQAGGGSAVQETFEIGQVAKVSGTAQALAGAAAAFAGRNDELGGVIRGHVQNRNRLRELDAALTRAAGTPAAQRDRAAETAARAEFERLTRAAAETEARLARDFPRYAELSNPQPLSTRDATALLRPDEALLVYFLEGQRSHLWVVTREQSAYIGLQIRPVDVEAIVKELRAGATPQRPTHFPVARAHELYRRILGPAENILQGKQHLILVLDGALESLPFGMLVTEPTDQPTDLAGYARVPWLAQKYVTSVLPSVSSLRLMREVIVKTPRAPLPFVGFGDAATGAAAIRPVAPIQREQVSLTVGSGFMGVGSAVNLEALRAAKALPETADELRSIARSLGAGDDKVFLRERFTKPTIFATPLDQYRVVAFSTHGAVAGEMRGVNEPFLLLTPPASLQPNDDGMLRASDVARLRLNADWVLLSACNTAAGDGTPGAEGLSGLAKAFLSAGTRSVLVSHWAVESQSAARLMTSLFAIQAANPTLARTGALRRAMLELMATQRYAHPMFWAPFVLVGEGVVSG